MRALKSNKKLHLRIPKGGKKLYFVLQIGGLGLWTKAPTPFQSDHSQEQIYSCSDCSKGDEKRGGGGRGGGGNHRGGGKG